MKTAHSESIAEAESYAELVATQRNYFNSNRTKSVDFRIAQLRRLRDLIRVNEGLLQEAIYEDFGKQPFDTLFGEFFLIYDEIDVAIRNLKEWSSRRPVTTNQLNMPATSYIVPEHWASASSSVRGTIRSTSHLSPQLRPLPPDAP
jgi:aldehyde dehydrogenase (NAD+)